MRQVLAELAVEADAAMQLAVRLADAVDRAETDLLRIGVAAAKFWVCKRTPAVVGEALECLGGAGYVEESPLPRLFRESPLNSIWEGSGNVIALDVLRALAREPAAIEALTAELASTAGADPRLDAAVGTLTGHLRAAAQDPQAAARQARTLTGLLARTLQASLLVRAADGAERTAIADAFLTGWVAEPPPTVFGTASAELPVRQLLEYAQVGPA
jgi:putative acyl-CoA dehydrogenase